MLLVERDGKAYISDNAKIWSKRRSDMRWLAEGSLVGVVVLAVLIFVFMKVRQKDLLGALVV